MDRLTTWQYESIFSRIVTELHTTEKPFNLLWSATTTSCDGLKALSPARSPLPYAAEFFSALELRGLRAGAPNYLVRRDRISMPCIESFREPAHFYEVLAHQVIHWSGAQPRLNRVFHARRSHGYYREELIAALGSAFISSALGLPDSISELHVPYISSVIEKGCLGSHEVVKAYTEARRAAEWLFEKYALRHGIDIRPAPTSQSSLAKLFTY